jgi:acetylornithine deacetylase
MTQDDALRAVLDEIDRLADDVVATLATLVRIPSVTPRYPGIDFATMVGGETRCNLALQPSLTAAGCTVDLWEEEPGRANLVGVLKGAGGGRSLIFNGHVDTVPPGDATTWKGDDPFSALVEDGKLYGLGAADMKAGVVAQTKAAEALTRCGIQLRGDLILESVVGEEMMEHERGTTATIRRGYVADAAIVTEPSALPARSTIAPCSPGGMWLKVTVPGKATHVMVRGSLIWPGGGGEAYGVNAIDKGLFVANALRKLEENWGVTKAHPLFAPGHFTIGPNVMLGLPPGPVVPFIVPHRCILDYIIVYHPEETATDVRAEVEAFLQGVFDQDPWLRVHRPTLEWLHDWPPYNTSVDHPICQTLAAAHARALDEPVAFHGFAAVDDATYLERGGIPAITFGPGNLLVCHAPNEYVEVAEVIRATKVYAATALAWCGVA